jgi:hypothetical protein
VITREDAIAASRFPAQLVAAPVALDEPSRPLDRRSAPLMQQ